MKKTITFLGLLSTILVLNASNANAQRGFVPPSPTDPSTYRGGLVAIPFTSSGYSPGTVTTVRLIENNGPTFSDPFISFGYPATVSTFTNLKALEPSLLGGGRLNDRARSAIFAGTLSGRTFTFYDDPNGALTDDYTEVSFYRNLPAGYSYYIWTFEGSYYVDNYVIVYHHYVNGLDGKVSSFRVESGTGGL